MRYASRPSSRVRDHQIGNGLPANSHPRAGQRPGRVDVGEVRPPRYDVRKTDRHSPRSPAHSDGAQKHDQSPFQPGYRAAGRGHRRGSPGPVPGTQVELCPGGAGATPGATRPAAWDDLLAIVFGAGPLTPTAQAAAAAELEWASAGQRPPRLLPISADCAHRTPPAPLDAIKALPCFGSAADELERIGRRIGALLGLWTRGKDKRIFVSYRAADGFALAEQVAGFLQGLGYAALRDEEWLEGGDVVQDEIERHLESASLVLLLDTPRAAESRWIKQEIDMAIRNFVPILPVVLRPAGDRRQGPSFRALMELGRWHQVGAELDGEGRCRSLPDDMLPGLLAEMELYLSDILRIRAMLARLAADSFERAGFAWSPLAPERGLYETFKADEHFAAIRMLTHCSPLPPTFHRAVEAFKRHPGQGQGPESGGLRYNFRIFLHEGGVPPLELESVAQSLGMREEAQLRVLDLTRLEEFIARFNVIANTAGVPT